MDFWLWKRMNIAIESKHMPNVAAVAKREASGNNVHEKQLLDYADTCFKPAYDYFKLKFDQDVKPAMNAFKAAWLFSPSNAYFMYPIPSRANVDQLSVFPFSIFSQLPDNLSAAEDVSSETDAIA